MGTVAGVEWRAALHGTTGRPEQQPGISLAHSRVLFLVSVLWKVGLSAMFLCISPVEGKGREIVVTYFSIIMNQMPSIITISNSPHMPLR